MKHQSDSVKTIESTDMLRKPYDAPAILYEFILEVRAGSPLSPGPDMFDSLLDP